MGIKSFFRKIGNGIRKAGRFIKDKVFPVVGRIAKPVLNVIGALPGVAGVVGRIGSGIANVLHGATDQIPNEDAKKRINDVISRGNQAFQGAVDRGREIAEGANNAIGIGRNIVRGVTDVVRDNGRDIANHFKTMPVDWKSKIGPK